MVFVCLSLPDVSLSFSPPQKVAEVTYVATLEDLGLIKAKEVIVTDSSQVTYMNDIFILVHIYFYTYVCVCIYGYICV